MEESKWDEGYHTEKKGRNYPGGNEKDDGGASDPKYVEIW